MPLAVTHVLLSIIGADLYRDYFAKHKSHFTLHTILLVGIFGLLPDIDIAIKFIFNIFDKNIPEIIQHGGITHTPFFILPFIIVGILFYRQQRYKSANIFLLGSAAILLHLILDFVIGGGASEGIMIFFPFITTTYKLHLIHMWGLTDIPVILDTVILLAWLWHEEYKHKIIDFI